MGRRGQETSLPSGFRIIVGVPDEFFKAGFLRMVGKEEDGPNEKFILKGELDISTRESKVCSFLVNF